MSDYRELDCNHSFLKNGYCMLCGFCVADPTKPSLDIDNLIESRIRKVERRMEKDKLDNEG